MSVFSYHLIKLPLLSALKFMLFPIKANKINGLVYAETMSVMLLGSSIFSMSRLFSREIAVLAQWENEKSISTFLASNKMGKQLSKGWYITLEPLRQWGKFTGFKITDLPIEENENALVVAITIARMKYTQILRFLSWGKPVEQQVRDHAGTTLSLASIRYPNTISTFSIWKTQKEMTDMVHGHSKMPHPKRHSNAMKEHNKKSFHFEFTTLRFKPIAEYGEWKNKTCYAIHKTS